MTQIYEGLLEKSGYDHAKMLEFLLFVTREDKNPGFGKQTRGFRAWLCPSLAMYPVKPGCEGGHHDPGELQR